MRSVIKYYGGKSYMVDVIKSNFPSEFRIYIEGFGGGASVLFSKDDRSPVEIYNDLDSNVWSLFKVLNDKDMFMRLKERMDLTYYSRRMYEEAKEQLNNPELSVEDRCYWFLNLNRMSFNGVGGFSTSTGTVRRGMSKPVSDYLHMIETLPQIHDRLSSVIVENLDIFDLIDKYDCSDGAFFYLDPPYVQSTRKSGQKYRCEMDDSDHIRFVQRLNSMKSKVLISGYSHPIYDGLNDTFRKIEFNSPNSGSDAVEILWRNY